MGLLKLTNDINGIDYIDHRDILYYNKYKYRAQFNIYGLRRASFHNDIDSLIKRLEYVDPLGSYGFGIYYRELSKHEVSSTFANIDKLTKYMDWVNARKKDKKATIRVEQDNAGIFSNDLDLLKTLADIFDGDTSNIIISEAKCSGFVGTRMFTKQPKHKFRVYLRNRVVDSNLRQSVNKILKTNKKSLFPSQSFKSWLIDDIASPWRHRYMSSSYFIDYDDDSMISYLGLMHGEILGKRYKLEKRPDTV